MICFLESLVLRFISQLGENYYDFNHVSSDQISAIEDDLVKILVAVEH